MEDLDGYVKISNEDFIVGKDNFDDLEINPTSIANFHYFFNRKDRKLIKQFILDEKPKVRCVAQVILIKKGDKFTPRLTFSIRDRAGKIVEIKSGEEDLDRLVKANVNLDDCHENLWSLISYLQSFKDIETPGKKFSLVSQDEGEIVAALRHRDPKSVINIIKQLSSTAAIALSENDINQLLKRKEKLDEFQKSLEPEATNEGWWQDFFEQNKWIFGYGLNYQILRQEQPQPHYGGGRVDGKGGQRGDYLTSTEGDLNFTILVEIKTPATPLLQGKEEIRNGAWSLSKDLIDALSQLEANLDTWEKQGARQPDNEDRLEDQNIFTVEPKGIIVIGSLAELTKERSKRETFQRFRRSIHGVDIITFDEILKRAKFIVDST